jgi:hypothetical protein
MSVYFPSQIVEYIDNKFPSIKDISSGEQKIVPIGPEYKPIASLILRMIDAIPPRVMILKGDDLIEYGEAVEAIRHVVDMWGQGHRNYIINKIPGRKNWNPIALVRKNLLTLSDEGVDPETHTLLFIKDDAFNKLLKSDITSVNTALENGEWKAATVLAGSVIEAILLYIIKESSSKNSSMIMAAVQALQSAGKIRATSSMIEEWNLYTLIEIAYYLKYITDNTAEQCRIAKEYRNLVHPGRTVRLAQTCDRGTALSAVAGMEHVIRDLSKSIAG